MQAIGERLQPVEHAHYYGFHGHDYVALARGKQNEAWFACQFPCRSNTWIG